MKKVPLFLFVLFMGLMISSCTPPSLGIFWALEKEQPVPSPDKGLSKELPVSKVFRHGTRWVVQAAKLFISNDANVASHYSAATIPSSYLSILDSESVGSNLFATFVNATSSGLFYSSNNGNSWTKINGADNSDHAPWDILTNGSRAFIVNMEDEGDRGFYDGDESFTIQEITTPSGTPGLSTAFDFPTTMHPKFLVDIGGTLHIISNKGAVFVDAGGNTWNTSTDLPSSTYTAIAQKTGTTVLVSYNGTVATTTDGTTWDTSGTLKDNSTALQFTSVIWPSSMNNYFDNRILVGTAKTGLYYVSLPGGSASNASARALDYHDGNYYSTNSFKQSPITFISGGTSPSIPVMVGTSEQGLWSGLWDGSPEEPSEPGIFWTHE